MLTKISGEKGEFLNQILLASNQTTTALFMQITFKGIIYSIKWIIIKGVLILIDFYNELSPGIRSQKVWSTKNKDCIYLNLSTIITINTI